MTIRVVGTPIAFRIVRDNCGVAVEYDKEDESLLDSHNRGVHCPGCGCPLLTCDAEPVFVRERTGRPLVVP